MLDSGIKRKKFILFVGDIILLYFSLWATILIRYASTNGLLLHILPFSIVYGVLLIILYIDGLYEIEFGKNRTDLLNKLAMSIVIGSVFATTFFYFMGAHIFTIRPQRVLLINFIFVFIFLLAWRIIFYKFIRTFKLANNTLIIGNDALAQEIIKKIIQTPELGFSLKAILSTNIQSTQGLENIHIFSDSSKLNETCEKFFIHTIIFADYLKKDEEILKNLFSCLHLNITFYELSNFYEKTTGKIPVDYIENVWFLENLRNGSKKFYEIAKRTFDIAVSLALLIFSLPFIPIIILAIKMDSKGSFLFKQIRVGKNGKHFMAIKFRTMISNAESNGPQWAQKNDYRVTKVGKFLRKTRVDEIPQLFNVFRGEMSLIGPRPERPEFIQELKKQIPFYEERLLIKPGLTGWAQVMGPSYGGSYEESLKKIQYDLYYIKNRSFGLDVSITLKTIKTVLSAAGQ